MKDETTRANARHRPLALLLFAGSCRFLPLCAESRARRRASVAGVGAVAAVDGKTNDRAAARRLFAGRRATAGFCRFLPLCTDNRASAGSHWYLVDAVDAVDAVDTVHERDALAPKVSECGRFWPEMSAVSIPSSSFPDPRPLSRRLWVGSLRLFVPRCHASPLQGMRLRAGACAGCLRAGGTGKGCGATWVSGPLAVG